MRDWPKLVALRIPNGGGKTDLIAGLVLYWLSTVPACRVVVTSQVYRQLEMMATHLYRMLSGADFKGWRAPEGYVYSPNDNICRYFATDSPGAVESQHPPPGGFLIAVLDEVKSMDDDIVAATDRWNPKLKVYVSSAGLRKGAFYRCFSVQRHLWHRVEAKAYECAAITQGTIDDLRNRYGEESPQFRSQVENEFSSENLRAGITVEILEWLIKHPPPHEHTGIKVGGLDLSAARQGGDECVMFWRWGNMIKAPILFNGIYGDGEIVGAVCRAVMENGLTDIFADAGGLGAPLISWCETILGKAVRFHRIHNGAQPISDKMRSTYTNRITECWMSACEELRKYRYIFPTDEKTIGQLAGRELILMPNGASRVETKDEMRDRGQESPDRGEALVYCLQNPVTAAPQTFMSQMRPAGSSAGAGSRGQPVRSANRKYTLGRA